MNEKNLLLKSYHKNWTRHLVFDKEDFCAIIPISSTNSVFIKDNISLQNTVSNSPIILVDDIGVLNQKQFNKLYFLKQYENEDIEIAKEIQDSRKINLEKHRMIFATIFR